MGHRAYHRVIDGKQYPPEVIEAWILNKLRSEAIQQIGPFDQAVITVPAYFDEVRRKATQDAGYMAGCEVLDIINEPTAAAVAFGFQQGFLDASGSSDQPRRVLVYDLGGGTFDVTVMEIRGSEFLALSTDGDVALGGYDWDQRLLNLAADAFQHEHGLDPRESSAAAGKLWRECEDAKRTLSTRSKAPVVVECQGKVHRVEISRQQFEEATQDLLDRTRFTCVQALRAAGLDWPDLDRVLLVGGSTRMPMVRAMLQKVSGKTPDASVAADEAVAHGAALQAGLILARRAAGRRISAFATSTRTASAWWASIRRPGVAATASSSPATRPCPSAPNASSRQPRTASDRSSSRSWRAKALRPTTARPSAAARWPICRSDCRPSRR